MRTMDSTRPERPYKIGIVTKSKVMNVRREFDTPKGLLEGYLAMRRLYSNNAFGITPIPFEKRGREKIRQMEEVVSGVEMNLPTKQILESIEAMHFGERMVRHHIN